MHCGRPKSGEAEVVGGNDFLDDFLRQGRPLPEDIASSDERCAHRKTECAGYLSSGEATLVIGRLWFCSSVFYYNCILVAFMLSLVKSKE